MAQVVRGIVARADWDMLDAILFPAGYLRLNGWLGPLPGWMRVAQIDQTDGGAICRRFVGRLGRRSPGCLLVVGIDTPKPNSHWRGDQFTAVFSDGSGTACVRKIFPVDGDTNGIGRAPYLLFDHDFTDGDRVLPLANGENALLSACYDAFLPAELALGPTGKRGALRYAGDGPDGYADITYGEANRMLEAAGSHIRAAQPRVHLAAVHGFARPGAEVYWQRHGIATASAALSGALSVGAAHFKTGVPAFWQAPLASRDVPRRHLKQQQFRRAETLAPFDAFVIGEPAAPAALVRLYVDQP